MSGYTVPTLWNSANLADSAMNSTWYVEGKLTQGGSGLATRLDIWLNSRECGISVFRGFHTRFKLPDSLLGISLRFELAKAILSK